ncbi:hypothetical protein [Candidatus Nanohalococcus occultus]|uniref:Flagellin n=1 Tax=Candidatus Nanohalococcus occultus TaxID=2978047 RepID=A0ABY8CFL8_9ARCH|nr:hypothetical protein SVXNc_1010 [Candidatus Nanohaloarchaeota archaeon SVXNc]
MRRKGIAEEAVGEVTVGFLVALTAIVIVTSMSMMLATDDITGSPKDKVESIANQIADRCQAVNEEDKESYDEQKYVLGTISNLKIDTEDSESRLVAELESSTRTHVLNDDCSYEWPGTSIDGAEWSINVSAQNPSSPKIVVEAEKQ